MTDKITIVNDQGARVEAQAPLIVSASRSTDIPAFYGQWFINRLKAGYAVRYNPFNRQAEYVSFKKTKAVVFWSKNPAPLLPLLGELDDRGIGYYFQFTLNDYEAEGFEPNVPPLGRRIETFQRLAGQIGKERVVWRFDPLIVAPQLGPQRLLQKIRSLGERLKGCTDKLVFSFIDVRAYRKVQANLLKETSWFPKEYMENPEFSQEQIRQIAEGLAEMRDSWQSGGRRLALATCAEPVCLEAYGIEHNRCIDSELMKRLFPGDKDWLYYLNHGKAPEKNLLFAGEAETAGFKKWKDKGQRKACGCMLSKDIGMYDSCGHFCLYCYANTSRKAAGRNMQMHRDSGESIV
jgi:DNA repair photolyase